MYAQLFQLCLTLCDPMDCSPSGSSVHGTLQAKILEWGAIFSSRESSPPRDQTNISKLQADSLLSEPPGKSKTNLVACLIYCPKPKFCSGSLLPKHPKPKFLRPVNFSQIYCFFAKKCKSCLLFLGSIFMRPLPSQIKFVFILPAHLSWVHFIISPPIPIQGDLRGKFPPLPNKQVSHTV